VTDIREIVRQGAVGRAGPAHRAGSRRQP